MEYIMLFEQASRLKVRFDTVIGMLAVEDLWDLPLTARGDKVSLDQIAIFLNKQVKEDAEESFVKTAQKKDKILDVMFELVKHIINVKIDEEEVAKLKADNKVKKQRLVNILATKEDEELVGKSADEIKQLINELS